MAALLACLGQRSTGEVSAAVCTLTSPANNLRAVFQADVRDFVLSSLAYFRQARNLDAEREAANVRLRAERCAGEWLKGLAWTTLSEAGTKGNVAVGRMSADAPCDEPSRCLAPFSPRHESAGRCQALAAIPRPELRPLNFGARCLARSSGGVQRSLKTLSNGISHGRWRQPYGLVAVVVVLLGPIAAHIWPQSTDPYASGRLGPDGSATPDFRKRVSPRGRGAEGSRSLA